MTDDVRRLAASLIAASPLAISIADARAHTHKRRRKLLAPASTAISPHAEPDFSPVPMPVLDAPESFAKDFWNKRRPPGPDDEPPKPKPKKPRGRKPVGDLPPGADRFRVIDGDDGDKRK